MNYRLSKFNNGPLSLGDIENLDVKNPNWAAVRAVMTANMIYPYLVSEKIEPRVIVEIGPGSGNLLYCLKRLHPNATCFIVDLPSSIVFSFCNLINKLPDSKFLLPNEISGAEDFTDYDFVFLRDDQIDVIPDNFVDFMANTVSFAEMKKNIVDSYFKFLRRISKKNNAFYCLNRVEKLMEYDGGNVAIRFHEYPWLTADKDLFYRLSELEGCITTGGCFFEKLTVLKT